MPIDAIFMHKRKSDSEYERIGMIKKERKKEESEEKGPMNEL